MDGLQESSQPSAPRSLTVRPEDLDPEPGIRVRPDAVGSALGENPASRIEQEASRFGLKKSSGLRSVQHNAAVGGAPASFHLSGQAADFSGDPAKMRAFSDHMKSTYGYDLEENIFGSGDHTDHVHIAWKKGAPTAKVETVGPDFSAPRETSAPNPAPAAFNIDQSAFSDRPTAAKPAQFDFASKFPTRTPAQRVTDRVAPRKLSPRIPAPPPITRAPEAQPLAPDGDRSLQTEFESAKSRGDLLAANRAGSDLEKRGWIFMPGQSTLGPNGYEPGWPSIKPPGSDRPPVSQGTERFAEDEYAARHPAPATPKKAYDARTNLGANTVGPLVEMGAKLLSGIGRAIDVPYRAGEDIQRRLFPKPISEGGVQPEIGATDTPGDVLRRPGEALSRHARQAIETYGGEGFAPEVERAAARTLPLLVTGPTGGAVLSALEAYGGGADPKDAAITGLSTYATMKLAGAGSELVDRAVAQRVQAGLAGAIARYGARVGATAAAPEIVNMIATQHGPTVDSLASSLGFGLVFGAMGSTGEGYGPRWGGEHEAVVRDWAAREGVDPNDAVRAVKKSWDIQEANGDPKHETRPTPEGLHDWLDGMAKTVRDLGPRRLSAGTLETGEAAPPTEPETPSGDTRASVPFVVTRSTRQGLADLGYSSADVDRMTPAEALEALGGNRSQSAPPQQVAPTGPRSTIHTPPGQPLDPDLVAAEVQNEIAARSGVIPGAVQPSGAPAPEMAPGAQTRLEAPGATIPGEAPTVGTPGEGAQATIPEPRQALLAQLDALRTKRGNRRAVLVTPGEQMPASRSSLENQGIAVTKAVDASGQPVGTFIHDPREVSRQTVKRMAADGSYHQLLGIVEPKSDATTEAVVSRGANGEEVQAALASPENVQTQVDELRAQHPGTEIAVESPSDAIAGRQPAPESPKVEAGGKEPQGYTRFYRADEVGATGPQGTNWVTDPEYASKKHGAGQMGSESIWYIDVPTDRLQAEFGDVPNGIVSKNLEAIGVTPETKLYRRVEAVPTEPTPATKTAVRGAASGRVARTTHEAPQPAEIQPKEQPNARTRKIHTETGPPSEPHRGVGDRTGQVAGRSEADRVRHAEQATRPETQPAPQGKTGPAAAKTEPEILKRAIAEPDKPEHARWHRAVSQVGAGDVSPTALAELKTATTALGLGDEAASRVAALATKQASKAPTDENLADFLAQTRRRPQSRAKQSILRQDFGDVIYDAAQTRGLIDHTAHANPVAMVTKKGREFAKLGEFKPSLPPLPTKRPTLEPPKPRPVISSPLKSLLGRRDLSTATARDVNRLIDAIQDGAIAKMTEIGSRYAKGTDDTSRIITQEAKRAGATITEPEPERKETVVARTATRGQVSNDRGIIAAIRSRGGVTPDNDIANYFSNKEGQTTGLVVSKAKGGRDPEDMLTDLIADGWFPNERGNASETHNRNERMASDILLDAMRKERTTGKLARPGGYDYADEIDHEMALGPLVGFVSTEDADILYRKALKDPAWTDLFYKVVDESEEPTIQDAKRFRAASAALGISDDAVEAILTSGEAGRSPEATDFAFGEEADVSPSQRDAASGLAQSAGEQPEDVDYQHYDSAIREPSADYKSLSPDDYQRVVAKLDSLKAEAKDQGRPLSFAIDRYMKQGDLFSGHELSDDQQALLRQLAERGKRAALHAEQSSLFDAKPTVESRLEQRKGGDVGGGFGGGGSLFEPKAEYGKQTDTPEFKKFFKGSQVSENGEPLVVYHGTLEPFDTFRTGEGNKLEGIFFTDNAEDAAKWATRSGGLKFGDPTGRDDVRVVDAYVRIRKPADEEVVDNAIASLERRGQDSSPSAVTEYLIRKGYDGYIDNFPGEYTREVVAFRPEQIKSATGNRGTFDPNDPNILKEPGAKYGDSQRIGIFKGDKLVGTASLSQDTNPDEWVKANYGPSYDHGPLTMENSTEPITVYHGTNADIGQPDPANAGAIKGATFYTDSPKEAGKFTGVQYGERVGEGANVIKTTVQFENPKTYDFGGKLFDFKKVQSFVVRAKADGNDGVIIKNIRNFPDSEPSTTYVDLNPRRLTEGKDVADRKSKYGTGENQPALFDRTTPEPSGLRGETDAVSHSPFDDKLKPVLRRAIRDLAAKPHKATFGNLKEVVNDYLDEHQLDPDESVDIEAVTRGLLTEIGATEHASERGASFFMLEGMKIPAEARGEYTPEELAQYRANLGKGGFSGRSEPATAISDTMAAEPAVREKGTDYKDDLFASLKKEFGIEDLPHHSELQPRADDGTFNGPPDYPERDPRAEKERALPRTLEEAGMRGGENRTYLPDTERGWMDAAHKTLHEKGLTGTGEFLKGLRGKELTGDNIATGVLYLNTVETELKTATGYAADKLAQAAVDVANVLSERLTKAGQQIRAVQIVNRLSPERQLLVAERKAEKALGRSLTPQEGAQILHVARQLQEAENKVGELEGEIAALAKLKRRPAPKASAPKIKRPGNYRDHLKADAEAAVARITAATGRANFEVKEPAADYGGSFDPLLDDYAAYGAHTMAQGMNRAEWEADMTERFGKDLPLAEIGKRAYERVAEARSRAMKPGAEPKPKTAYRETGERIRAAEQAVKKAQEEADRATRIEARDEERAAKKAKREEEQGTQRTTRAEEQAVGREAKARIRAASIQAREARQQQVADAKQQAKAAAVQARTERQTRLAEARQQLKDSQSAQKAAYQDFAEKTRETDRVAREKAVEQGRRDRDWRTPIREAATKARTTGANTVEDMVAVAAKELLAGPDPQTLRHKMIKEFGDDYKSNWQDVHKQANRIVNEARKDGEENKKLRSAMKEAGFEGDVGTLEGEARAKVLKLIEQRKAALKERTRQRMAMASDMGKLDHTWLNTADSVLKADLLAGLGPYSHKVGSLLTSTVANTARDVIAGMLDTMYSAATGTPRALTVDLGGLPLLTKRGLKRLPVSFKEAGQILKTGESDRRLEQGEAGLGKLVEEHVELPATNPIVTATNQVFRGYKGGAHVFGLEAYERTKGMIAKAEAINEAKRGVISKDDISARAEEIRNGDSVTSEQFGEIELAATQAYIAAIYQGDNVLNDFMKRLRRPGTSDSLGAHAWTFGVNRKIPFMKSASNVFLTTLDYAGVGPHGAIAESVRAGYRKGKYGEPFENVKQRRDFMKAWGALPVGISLMLLGAWLHKKGLMSSFIFNKDENPQPGSIGIGHKLVDIGRYSPPGALMAVGATIHEMYGRKRKKKDGTETETGWFGALEIGFGDLVSHLPLMQVGNIADELKQGTFLKKEFIERPATALVPAFAHEAYKGYEGAIRAKAPAINPIVEALGAKPAAELGPDKGYFGQVLRIREEPGESLKSMKARAEKLREGGKPDAALESQVEAAETKHKLTAADTKGKRRGDDFNSADRKPVHDELQRLGVTIIYPSNKIKLGDKEQKIPAARFEEFQREFLARQYAQLADMISKPVYQRMSDDDRRLAIEDFKNAWSDNERRRLHAQLVLAAGTTGNERVTANDDLIKSKMKESELQNKDYFIQNRQMQRKLKPRSRFDIAPMP